MPLKWIGGTLAAIVIHAMLVRYGALEFADHWLEVFELEFWPMIITAATLFTVSSVSVACANEGKRDPCGSFFANMIFFPGPLVIIAAFQHLKPEWEARGTYSQEWLAGTIICCWILAYISTYLVPTVYMHPEFWTVDYENEG